MKRGRFKKISVKNLRNKIVVNKKLIPKGDYCYGDIPDSQGVYYNDEYKRYMETYKVKARPYMSWDFTENEDGERDYVCSCSLLRVEIFEEVKECRYNLNDE